jgi:putative N6-adenine-specific DNA methylase
MLQITVKTMFGLEPALQKDLEEIGYKNLTLINRGVQLKGTWEDVYRLNLHIRCGISVLVELANFKFENKDDYYKKIRELGWPKWFDVTKTIAIRGVVQSTLFKNTQFPLLLAKDAILDDFRARTGDRPNIDLKNPQVVLDLYINENKCIVSINTSGDPLFKRGYRKEAGLAPLNEVVAAGMIYLSGWDRKSALIDPMCGSGTIVIEAAMMASNIPAGILRESFTFMHLKNFDRELWEQIFEQSKKQIQPVHGKIFASDLNEMMIIKSRRNIRTLPLARAIDLQVKDFKDLSKPADTGILICNPPYGERIGENVEALYKDLGDWMKQKMSGFSCWILSSNQDAIKNIGLKANKTIKLFNGSLTCEFRRYDIFDGGKKHVIHSSLHGDCGD